VDRFSIVAEARRWIGTPWRHQACKRGVGTDCLGLIVGVGVAVGAEGNEAWAGDARVKGYGRVPVPETLLNLCDEYLSRKPIAAALPGDILVMAFLKYPQHFAIVSALGPTYMVHAYAQRRQVIETRSDIPGAKLLRAYSYKGLDQ